jgi:hypothetical protein
MADDICKCLPYIVVTPSDTAVPTPDVEEELIDYYGCR